MMPPQPLDWQHPIALARHFAAQSEAMVLLHSSLPHKQHGRYSYLALNPQTQIENDWNTLAKKLAAAPSDALEERWFGWFGYEATHGPSSALPPASIALPRLWFAQFATVLAFDHHSQSLTCHGQSVKLPSQSPAPNAQRPTPKTISSNMTREQYLAIITQTLEQIRAGEFYQANITRKFFGQFQTAPDYPALFETLCHISPACYSALIKRGEQWVLSSSPECFLTFSANGRVESRPIKGTAPRSDSPADLQKSEKDRAENLMITDLVRNDLSRGCIAGSVKTESLFAVESYATLHHMHSTIAGQRRADCGLLEAIEHCFPPGSMTGAPKKAVMEWCAQQEGQQRGLYSGALGWLGSNGSSDLSVVIRTLIAQGNHFEFQVGGGIVADSQPEAEWQETLTKASALAKAISINIESLAAL